MRGKLFITKTTVKREWREEGDNEGVGDWVRELQYKKKARSHIWLFFILTLWTEMAFLTCNTAYWWICQFLHYPVWLPTTVTPITISVLSMFVMGAHQLKAVEKKWYESWLGETECKKALLCFFTSTEMSPSASTILPSLWAESLRQDLGSLGKSGIIFSVTFKSQLLILQL